MKETTRKCFLFALLLAIIGVGCVFIGGFFQAVALLLFFVAFFVGLLGLLV